MAELGAKRGPGQTRAMVLRLKLEGLTAREIAARVGISTQSVYHHLSILKKQNGRTR